MKQKDFSFLKGYLVPLLVLLTIIALIPWVIRPQVTRLKENYVKLQDKQERLVRLNDKIDTLDSIDQEEESSKLIESEKAVPSRKELAPWLNEVNILADKNGLIKLGINVKPGKTATEAATPDSTTDQSPSSVKSTKTTKPGATKTLAKKEEKEEIKFTVTLGGSLEAINQFLADLEGAKPILSATSVESKRQEDGTYRFDLLLIAPYKGVSKGGDAIAAAIPELTKALDAVFKKIIKMVSYTNVSVPKVPTGVEDPFK